MPSGWRGKGGGFQKDEKDILDIHFTAGQKKEEKEKKSNKRKRKGNGHLRKGSPKGMKWNHSLAWHGREDHKSPEAARKGKEDSEHFGPKSFRSEESRKRMRKCRCLQNKERGAIPGILKEGARHFLIRGVVSLRRGE